MSSMKVLVVGLVLFVVQMGSVEAQQTPRNLNAWPEWGGAFVRDVTVVCTWRASQGASRYEVEFTPYSGNWTGKPFIRNAPGISYRLGPMAPAGIPNSGYRVRVRAVSASGSKSSFTGSVSVSTN